MEKGESASLLLPSAEDLDQRDEIEELLQRLQQEMGWNGDRFTEYEGFWFRVKHFPPVIRFQREFRAHDTDIILCTNPKCGTTWLKALTFSIANRHIYSTDRSPLLNSNPHLVVPSLEFQIYMGQGNSDLESFPSPRIFSTHVPYQLLPNSIRDSKCRIIYICRNPLDQFISRVYFTFENMKEKSTEEPLSMDKAFDEFCRGISPYGPFWDHIGGYWDAHLKDSEKILFLKYEDLKEDIYSNIKKVAEFMGLPFSAEEEKQGLVDQIAKLCSFDNLKNLEVNRMGKYKIGKSDIVKANSFFRKGEVGDWVNYITPVMVERVENILQTRFGGSGLKFKFVAKDSS